MRIFDDSRYIRRESETWCYLTYLIITSIVLDYKLVLVQHIILNTYIFVR